MPIKLNGVYKIKYKEIDGSWSEAETYQVELIKTYLGVAEVVIKGLKHNNDHSIDILYQNRDKEMIILEDVEPNAAIFKIQENSLIKRDHHSLWVKFPLKNFKKIKHALVLL